MTLRRSLRHDRRGAVAVFLVVSLVPLIGFLALAIDFGMAMVAKSQIDGAADAAALKAVTTTLTAYQADRTSNYIAAGQTAGLAFYQAQLGTLSYGVASTPSVTVTGSNGAFTASVSGTATVQTAFASILGAQSVEIRASSAATLTGATHVAVQIMMDTSGSMGIMLDTTNDPIRLLDLIKTRIGTVAPPGGDMLVASAVVDGVATVNNSVITPTASPNGSCALACHNDTSTSGPSGRSNDVYGVARANGIRMRIDVVRDAVTQIIDQVRKSPSASYFQFGLYGMAESLTTLFPLGADLSAAYTAAQRIELSPTPAYCWNGTTPPLCNDPGGAAKGLGASFRAGAVPNTNFEVSAASLIASTLTPKPVADGLSAATPLRYMFLITDGVDDYTTHVGRDLWCCDQLISAQNTTNGVDGGSFSGASVCDRIKGAGVTLLVLYTRYNPVDVPTYYNQVAPLVEPIGNSHVNTTLRACASSPDNYFEANSESEIQAAMTKMVAIASAKAGRFTR